MAPSRFVVTSLVTLTPDTLATLVAGEIGTGAPSGPGNVGAVSPGTSGKYGWLPLVFTPGTVLYADSTAGSDGAQLLYQAIGSSNLMAFRDGTDAVGHACLSNLKSHPRTALPRYRRSGAPGIIRGDEGRPRLTSSAQRGYCRN